MQGDVLYYSERTAFDIIGEFWIPVVGYEKLYEVSNLARIKSLWDNVGRRRDFILSQYEDEDGYLRVGLGHKRKVKRFGVHQIVCAAFHPNPDFKPEVNHADGNKKNNLPHNVEWSTEAENSKHAVNTGLRLDCHAILNRDQVIEIATSNDSLKSLAHKYGVSESTISTIRIGKNWSSVTGIKRVKKPMKRVTKNIAIAIFNSKDKGVDLALKYGITTVTVSEIRTGRTWSKATRHVGN